MQSIVTFKIVQFIILCTFVVFISDFRKKEGMSPLVHEGWIHLLKISYLVPFLIYLQILFTMTQISAFDAPAMGLTLLGTALVGKAKNDLSSRHTWAGYCSGSVKLMTDGVYAYIRHPIYTGIFMLIAGSLFTILPRLNLSSSLALAAAALISVSYTMSFLAFLASKETRAMLAKHGPAFKHYVKTVHPFLPIRKYSATSIF